MKVLWFSNCVLSDMKCSGSGSWLYGMISIISDEVELYNITSSNVSEITQRSTNEIIEYIIPDYPLHEGIPSNENISKILHIIAEIEPDIIHIWGMEKYWARLYQREFIKGYPVLLEIQGVLSSLCNVFYGGLFPKEIVGMYGFRELVRPWDRLNNQFKRNIERSEDESLILKSFSYISTQSKWTRSQISFFTSANCKIYETLRPIRKEFYEANKWNKKREVSPIIYASVSYNAPFKGLHILLKALVLIKSKYPSAKLMIAGFNPNKPFYKENGYNRYIKYLIKKLSLAENVVFPGSLNAIDIIERLLKSDVFVNPSFVESYSASAAEALYLGVPSVLSYAGALPNFSEESSVAAYYSPMDFVDCASKIVEVFEDERRKKQMSIDAINQMEKRCSTNLVLNTQMGIYNDILNKH